MLAIYAAKLKVLISCPVTMQLICAFVFAYAKSRFSHDTAHICTCYNSHLNCDLNLVTLN